MSKFLTIKNENLSELNKENVVGIKAKAIKLNLFDENDLPIYPIYEIFNEKFPDFICQICLYFVVEPVECLTCNSIFCKKCLYEYTLYSKHCPNRCDIKYRPVNRILKNLINSVKVPCIYYHKGCREILTYESFYSHVKICEFSPYMCNQCHLVDVKENIENHCNICQKLNILKDFSNDNKKRFICRHCNLDIISFEEKQFWYDEFKMNKYVRKFLIHEYLCNEQIVFCNFCEKKFRLYDFMKHTENNLCLVNQLNNKISYLTHKIDYYESNIKNKKILEDEEELKKYKELSQMKKVEIPFSQRYGITQSLITNQIKQEEINEIKNEEKRKKKEDFLKEISTHDNIGKKIIKNVSLKTKKFKEKKNEITALIIDKYVNEKSNINNQSNYNIISALKSPLILTKDSMNKDDIMNEYEYNIDNIISENISKNNKLNKKSDISISITITHLLITEKNRDIFIVTDLNYYFLLANDFSSLLKKGNPTSTAITCITEMHIPNKGYFIALGTYSSNLQLLLPYDNKIMYTLNHTKKRIISLCYNESLMTLIVSSAKENSFYLWKYNVSKDCFEIKSTIKDNCWIWSIILINIQNKKYIATGGGDKTIKIWEFFPEESAAIKKLTIKSHHESVIKVSSIEIRYNSLIISGAFDGTVKIHEVKRIFNDEFGEISLTYNELITIYNKDLEIINLEYFYCNEEKNDDNEELCLFVNLDRNKGYLKYNVLFEFE